MDSEEEWHRFQQHHDEFHEKYPLFYLELRKWIRNCQLFWAKMSSFFSKNALRIVKTYGSNAIKNCLESTPDPIQFQISPGRNGSYVKQWRPRWRSQ